LDRCINTLAGAAFNINVIGMPGALMPPRNAVHLCSAGVGKSPGLGNQVNVVNPRIHFDGIGFYRQRIENERAETPTEPS
jgi:hypothetical protein